MKRVIRLALLVGATTCIFSFFGCRNKHILDGPGMVNDLSWKAFTIYRGDSYAQHNFSFTVERTEKGYLLTGVCRGKDGDEYDVEEGMLLSAKDIQYLRILNLGDLPDVVPATPEELEDTAGYGITAFTDAGIEYLGNRFVPSLSDGDYAGAFEIYANTCDEFITQAKTGDPYDTHNLPKEPFAFLMNLGICFVIGLVIAAIATAIMKGQLKSVRSQSGAANYVKTGSLNVTHRQDLFRYRDVKRTAKPKDSGGSSTHTSSSGRSHGGGGGKF